ncbi:MAG: hypothetical protein RLZZ303_2599 [Candidatus Hydrogenedentota bacterium]
MQNLIRKHRVLFGSAIFLIIGIPMLFFGVPNFMDGTDMQDPTVITVGDIEVKASEFRRNLDAVAQSRAMGGERPTYAELDKDGAVGEVLDNLVNAALLRAEVEERGFPVSEEFLINHLRKESIFLNEEGNFDPEAWNTWVKNQQDNGLNWNSLYEDYRKDLGHQTYLDLIRKPAGRILESELDYQLTDDYTKIKVRYLQVSPPIDEALMREYFDKNVEEFRNPENKRASVVTYSLRAEKPAKADELVAQARGGADFATLANENSDLKTENGGDMGWRRQSENELEHRKPMFAMQPGEVSDAIEGPNGFYIYKVLEERRVDDAGNVIPAEAQPAEGEPTGTREVRVSQIFVQATVTDEDKAARQAQAQALADRAAELGGLQQAAAEAGVTVAQIGPFTDRSTEIEGIPTADVFEFRRAFTDAEIAPYNVIAARDAVYVAVLDSKEPGEIPPFEEVREAVQNRYTSDAAEYREKVELYAKQLEEAAITSLDQAKVLFPDMTAEIAELDFFTRKDMLWQQQFYVAPTQIYEEVGRKPIGSVSKALQDFRNNYYFVELADRQEPTEEDKAKWPEEKERLREQIASRKGMDIIEDYALYLRQTKIPATYVSMDNDLISLIIGREDEPALPEEAPAGAAATDTAVDTTVTTDSATEAPPTEAAPATDAPAESTEAPAAEPAPAAEAPAEATEALAAETPAEQ